MAVDLQQTDEAPPPAPLVCVVTWTPELARPQVLRWRDHLVESLRSCPDVRVMLGNASAAHGFPCPRSGESSIVGATPSESAGDPLEALLDWAEVVDLESSPDAFVIIGYEALRRVVDRGLFPGKLWVHAPDLPQGVIAADAAPIVLGDALRAVRYWFFAHERSRETFERAFPDAVRATRVLPMPAGSPAPAPESPAVVVCYQVPANDPSVIERDLQRLISGRDAWSLHLVLVGAADLPADDARRLRALATGQAAQVRIELADESMLGQSGPIAAQRLVWFADLGRFAPDLELPGALVEAYLAAGRAVCVRRSAERGAWIEGGPIRWVDGFDEVLDWLDEPVPVPANGPGWPPGGPGPTAVLEPLIAEQGWRAPRPKREDGRTRAMRVVIAGHDLKFTRDIVRHLERLPFVTLEIDEWTNLAEHDEARSEELSAWANVVWCEWCAGAAVWYAQRRRPDQRIVVRYHAFEERTTYPARLEVENVDELVFIARHKELNAQRRFSLPTHRSRVIPNPVDVEHLHRPKHPDARFTLGMLGVLPALKQWRTCLELLERLRIEDRRFQLRVKSRMPWELPWMVGRKYEQEEFRRTFEEINRSALLAQAVIVDPHDAHVAAWFRHVGFVLSTSRTEGCHTAVGEGMSAGSVPIVLGWGGASLVYGDRFVVDNIDAAVERILSLAGDPAAGSQIREEGRAFVQRHQSARRVMAEIHDVLFGLDGD